MQFKDQAISHFHKTNAILKNSILASKGWDGVIADPEKLVGKQAFGYVWDQETDWFWMFSVQSQAFQDVPKMVATNNSLNAEDLAGSLQAGLDKAITGRFQKEEPANWDVMLSTMVIAYAGTTKTWSLANKMIEGGHFIVLRYKGENGEGHLRPFYISPTDDMPVDKDKLLGIIHQVAEVDHSNHPEWFA